MGRKYAPGEKRKIIIDYIKNNQKTTHNEIKENTKLKIEREYKKGISKNSTQYKVAV